MQPSLFNSTATAYAVATGTVPTQKWPEFQRRRELTVVRRKALTFIKMRPSTKCLTMELMVLH